MSHQLGLALRDEGIAKLERHEWMEEARLAAEAMCHIVGYVTSDILHCELDEPPHVNCWGAVFHDKRFRWDGTWVQTKRPSGHARWIRRWVLA